MTYQGHKNYNCWNISLWIDNEYDLYKCLQRLLITDKSKDQIASEMVEVMNQYFETNYQTHDLKKGHTPDGVKITFSNVREHLRQLKRNEY